MWLYPTGSGTYNAYYGGYDSSYPCTPQEPRATAQSTPPAATEAVSRRSSDGGILATATPQSVPSTMNAAATLQPSQSVTGAGVPAVAAAQSAPAVAAPAAPLPAATTPQSAFPTPTLQSQPVAASRQAAPPNRGVPMQGAGCARPEHWCTHTGSSFSFEMDCDGDGIVDPYCQDTAGKRGYRSSASLCAETWPVGMCLGLFMGDSKQSQAAAVVPATSTASLLASGPEQRTREAFASHGGVCSRPVGWCTHQGAQFSMEDCDGDGIEDPMCEDSRGNAGFRGSASGCSENWPFAVCLSPSRRAAAADSFVRSALVQQSQYTRQQYAAQPPAPFAAQQQYPLPPPAFAAMQRQEQPSQQPAAPPAVRAMQPQYAAAPLAGAGSQQQLQYAAPRQAATTAQSPYAGTPPPGAAQARYAAISPTASQQLHVAVPPEAAQQRYMTPPASMNVRQPYWAEASASHGVPQPFPAPPLASTVAQQHRAAPPPPPTAVQQQYEMRPLDSKAFAPAQFRDAPAPNLQARSILPVGEPPLAEQAPTAVQSPQAPRYPAFMAATAQRVAAPMEATTVATGCARPSLWCTHPGSWFSSSMDCDGDGVPDPYCQDSQGRSGFRSSVGGCSENWPSGICRRGDGGR